MYQKGFPEELESVVRDLWALRLQSIIEKQGGILEGDTESQVYSSQTEGLDTETEAAIDNQRKDKEMPSLVDTLSLCYLGMILLRIPISLGEIYQYVPQRPYPSWRLLTT